MKYFIISFLALASIGFCQTNSISTEKPAIIVNFTKNDSGEVVIKIQGHTQPLEIQFNGVKTGTLYEQDSAVNLSQLGFESSFLSLDTAGGKSSLIPDAQVSTIPPVTSAANPPLTTPY